MDCNDIGVSGRGRRETRDKIYRSTSDEVELTEEAPELNTKMECGIFLETPSVEMSQNLIEIFRRLELIQNNDRFNSTKFRTKNIKNNIANVAK